ncbi:Gamma-aminobutyric acid type B receptor subunit 2 [Zootermopsis nevadensis]|uniref:Gamma-aminobutyric acid type B receptor subunit 2 n=1 Tax=Zootermopsis nevadensis TaxID=136037 RepID=A0A067RF46_ZOONE|nr:Gamma-aminobutyric acid type B receptor subunit 2 [Zootermopsis nevadensis]
MSGSYTASSFPLPQAPTWRKWDSFTLLYSLFVLQCDPGVGVDAFFHALYTQKSTRMVMLLGTACSDVTESLAKVMPYWNILQVSFGSTAPALSDRQEFPLFYRTVAPDSSHNPARLAFVRGLGWDTVTALSQNEDVYSLAVNDLVTELEQANITCQATITFAESDFKDQLRMLRDLDTRIIIGSFSHEVAPKIFCEAHQLGMYGADYAWILQGAPSDIWWENVTECPQHHLTAAVEGLLLVSSHNSIVGVMPSYSGLTNSRFLEEFELLSLPVTRYAPQTYDAVWAIALALRGAQQKWETSEVPISLHHFDYGRKDMTEEFLSQLGQLDFLGVSGPVSFSGADRIGISAFYQVQGGEVSKVALFYPSSDHMDYSCPDCRPLVWQGGQVPIAKRVCKLRVVTIEPAAFLSITCLALVGITLAFAFLAFNLHFRKLKYIKLSSPRLNNMAVVGCILVYTAVILLGLDHATLPTNTHFPVVCTARVYLLSAGFSLAFGSMFTKTYRVHRIFTRSRSGVVKNKLLQDTQLISLICVLLLIDGLIMTLWVIIDPLQRHLRNLTLEISASDRSVVYQPQVEVCRSQYTHGWLAALYGYKGLLLIVGVYMAWETRHVKIPALNDSQYIGMSVYSVVITSVIVVVLANLISEQATLAFVTITTLILTSTTATLCLLFLPKLHAILGRAADNGDPVMHSMGLKIEYNTRRFVTDDQRELQYRVEIQNRVYRREIAALDLEICRLKRQLIESPNTSSDSTSEEAASKKTDLSPDERGTAQKHNVMEMLPSPSVGGGLPLLLLSVLPPVIPRASWPSAEHGNLPMRRQVTFSSEPKLDDSIATGESSRKQECYIICDHQDNDMEASGKPGVFSRLKNLLGSRPSSRKTSTASFSGTSTGGGIASALRVHMGYLAGLVPNSNMAAMTSSCNTSVAALNQYGLSGGQSSRELHPLKRFCGRAGGGSGPIISVTSNDEPEVSTYFDGEDSNSANRRKFSLGMCLSHKEEKDFGADERRIIYSSVQKGMMQHQRSQPVLSFRERAKGSPRFPHRIVPTCSLNALEDRRRSSSSAGAASYGANPSGSNPSYLARCQSSQHHLHVSAQTVGGHGHMGGKCRSLEDATSTGAGLSSTTGGGSNWKPRAASYSPNCDVWATAEFGIPLSELGNSGRCRDKNIPQSVQRRDSQVQM